MILLDSGTSYAKILDTNRGNRIIVPAKNMDPGFRADIACGHNAAGRCHREVNELVALAKENRIRILFSGTVAGALPVVNIGTRDLNVCAVERVEGIFNSTTNYILCRMEDEGLSFREALAGAQEGGIAERDPTLDIDGWDAANKLVIVANSVLNRPTRLQDVDVTGIREISREDLLSARSEGRAIKLLATAVRNGDDYELVVRPTSLPLSHPLAGLRLWDMGVVYHTDTMGTLTAIIEEQGAMPTAAAVLRDMINAFC